MAAPITHIGVCICTYQRTHLLSRLLLELACQETAGLFTYSLTVVDNDASRSAETVVSQCAHLSHIPITYCVEPRQSIALARNRAVSCATGDYIAFIDDDELPGKEWLLTLFAACLNYEVDGVLGPVLPVFSDGVPRWIVKGRFYERPSYDTGVVLTHGQTRTGNVLLKEHVFRNIDPPFRPEFRAGEDVDFFRRAMEQGHVFIWCNDAMVYEGVPPARWKRIYLLKKALLRGASAALRPSVDALDIAKSVAAVLIYGLALPFVTLLGQHRVMDLLVRLCHHLGKLLAVLGINPVPEPYVPE
jgi:succinoglycan biosynthesis protein ExoM